MKLRRGWYGVVLMSVALVAFLAALVGFYIAGGM